MPRTPGTFTKARPAKDARQRAWQAMRILRQFSAWDVQAVAEINEENLRKYVKALQRAGYLARIKAKANGASMGHARYRLARDSGPKHPIVRKHGLGVFDPNTGAAWDLSGKRIDSSPLSSSDLRDGGGYEL